MFSGSMVALVTPMHADGSIDKEALYQLVEWHIAEKTDALVVIGTTGESATLSFDARVEVAQAVVEQANGRIPVIAGNSSNATHEVISLTRALAEVGVDACLCVTPYYNKPTQEGLVRHFEAVADAHPMPQILYNVPSRTQCDLLPETVARLVDKPNIIGIKEATGELDRVKKLQALCGHDFPLYSGDDPTALEFMRLGGQGVISVTANVAPKAMRTLCAHALAGEWAQAEALDETLAPLHAELFCQPNPIPVKWALAQLGRCQPYLRLPLLTLDEAFQPAVLSALKRAHCL